MNRKLKTMVLIVLLQGIGAILNKIKYPATALRSSWKSSLIITEYSCRLSGFSGGRLCFPAQDYPTLENLRGICYTIV